MGSYGNCFGFFMNGQPHGLTISLFDNAKYIGETKAGLKDGRGCLIFKKGIIFIFNYYNYFYYYNYFSYFNNFKIF